MPELQHLALFILAGWLLNLTPGPDVLCIVTHALRHGVKRGLAAALGVTAGTFVHIFAAAVGVSALIAASATAFAVLRWVGAAYLIYVGIRMLIARAPSTLVDEAGGMGAEAPSWGAAFRSGFWTNALNPKVALFFLAFLPQFIVQGAGHEGLGFLLLGLLFNLNALPVNLAWALAAAWLARRVGAVRRGLHALERTAGALFILFGLRLAFTDAPGAAPSH